MGEEAAIIIQAGAGWGEWLCSRLSLFNSGKKFPVLTEWEALWSPEQMWAFCKRDRFLAPVRDRIMVSNPWSRLCTEGQNSDCKEQHLLLS